MNLRQSVPPPQVCTRLMTSDELLLSGEDVHDHCWLWQEIGYAVGVGIMVKM